MNKKILIAVLLFDVLIFSFIGIFLIYLFKTQQFAKDADLNKIRIETTENSHEAIVVLTGDRNRIPTALGILKRKTNDILVISGTARGISLTDIVNQQYAAENVQGVWQKIILESESNSTLENAKRLKPILEDHKIENIILVTSDYHLYRTSLIFKKVFPKLNIEYYPVISDAGFSIYFSEFAKFLSFKLYFSLFV